MVDRIYLTPEDLRRIDPTGRGYEWIETLKRSKESFNESRPKYKNLVEYAANVASKLPDAHAPYRDYALHFLPKCGPQGGRYAFNRMVESIKRYYVRVPEKVEPNYAILGAQYLVRYVKQLKQKFGTPNQFQTSPVVNTLAALPSMRKKGTFEAEAFIGDLYWRHLLPSLPGQRRLKGKDRNIFMDSNENVRYIEGTLSQCRQWLKSYMPQYFHGWMNPDCGLRENITKRLDQHYLNIELDADSMDTWFSREISERVILPIYEALLDEAEFWHLSAYVHEAFEQPLFLGDSMLVGLHDLFSGQPITNDFETLFDVCVAIGIALAHHVSPDKWYIAANGDDVIFLLHPSYDGHYFNVIKQAFLDEYEACSIKISVEKSRFATEDYQFCKKIYYRKGKRNEKGFLYGSYSSLLAANSIENPEKSSKTAGSESVAVLQILDNLYGSPDWNNLVQKVFSLGFDLNFTEVDIRTITEADWWFRCYGERWDPLSSPSFILMMQLAMSSKC